MELANPLLVCIETQPFTGPHAHPGVDYMCLPGTSVYAAADGIVKASYTSQGSVTREGGPPWSYGERIIIEHIDCSETTYNHLSARLVNEGQQVSKGQKIAESGNTGYSSGPHLHFEYREGGITVDPTPNMTGESPSIETKDMALIAIALIACAALVGILVFKPFGV
jgi:murein DD-endopeptidase MepM/ murein hydrolase activator NlpD